MPNFKKRFATGFIIIPSLFLILQNKYTLNMAIQCNLSKDNKDKIKHKNNSFSVFHSKRI